MSSAANCRACGTDPVTGFYRDGCCAAGPDQAVHLVCAVVTAEFLGSSGASGNDLITPVPEYGFPGLQPGDRLVCGCATVASGPRGRCGSTCGTGIHQCPSARGDRPGSTAAVRR